MNARITETTNLSGLREQLERIGDRPALLRGGSSRLEGSERGFFAKAAAGLRSLLSRMGFGPRRQERQEAAMGAFRSMISSRFSPAEARRLDAEFGGDPSKATGTGMLSFLDAALRRNIADQAALTDAVRSFDPQNLAGLETGLRTEAEKALHEAGYSAISDKDHARRFDAVARHVFSALMRSGEARGGGMLEPEAQAAALKLAVRAAAALSPGPGGEAGFEGPARRMSGPLAELGAGLAARELKPEGTARALLKYEQLAAASLAEIVAAMESGGAAVTPEEAGRLRGALEHRAADLAALHLPSALPEADAPRLDRLADPDGKMRTRMAAVFLGMDRARAALEKRGGTAAKTAEALASPRPLLQVVDLWNRTMSLPELVKQPGFLADLKAGRAPDREELARAAEGGDERVMRALLEGWDEERVRPLVE